MKTRMMYVFILLMLGTTAAFGQGGGKAEPLRINFAAGKSAATLTGSLANDQQMEYIFAARKGQMVTIRNAKPSLFDFRVFSDEFNIESEFDSSPSLTFTIPETGDYDLFVRKKRVKTPRTARFSVTISIK